MQPEFLCHLPFLRLPQSNVQALAGGGRLVSLPFEEWLAIEDPAMDGVERRYRNVAPVFVAMPLPDGEGIGQLTEAQERSAESIIERSYVAATLAMPTVAITPPWLSVAYVVWRGLPCDVPGPEGWFGPPHREPVAVSGDAGIQLGRIVVWLQQPPPGGGAMEQWVVERRFGPAQREWLLSQYATEADELSSDELQAFARHYERLARAQWGPRCAAAVRCADTLTAMLTVGIPLPDVVVLLVAALENLVNPKKDKWLGDQFSQRCAAWFAETPEERVRDQHRFRRLYAARSDILHGGGPEQTIRELMQAVGAKTEGDLRIWLWLNAWKAVDWLVAWYDRHPHDDGAATQFRKTLVDAAKGDTAQWLSKRPTLVEGRRNDRG